jgi:hypothetical protein
MNTVLRKPYHSEFLACIMEFRKDATDNTTKTNQIPSATKEDKSFKLVRNEAIVCNLFLRWVQIARLFISGNKQRNSCLKLDQLKLRILT